MIRPLTRFLSLALLSIGLLVMLAWLFDRERLQLLTVNGVLMAFNTGFCFAVAGGALLFSPTYPRAWRSAERLVGVFLILFPALVLSQDIFGVAFGIDRLFVSFPSDEFNLNPGRIAPPADICFMLAGIFLVLLTVQRGKVVNLLMQAIALSVLGVALLGITTISIRFELVYDWYRYGRMSMPTAVGFVVLAAALWLAWYHQEFRHYLDREDKRIGAVGILIITVVALTAGMSGFGLLAAQMEDTLDAALSDARNSHIDLVRNEVRSGIASVTPLTTRILLNKSLAAFDNDPNEPYAKEIIHQDVWSFLSAGFSAVAIYALSGEKLTEVGAFASEDSVQIPLPLSEPGVKSTLLWKTDAILHVEEDIVVDGSKIGVVSVELKLPNIGTLLRQADSMGATAETRICYAVSDDLMQCLPSHRNPDISKVVKRINENGTTSMDLALRGQAGLRVARDYLQHRVVTAFGPVAPYGIGLVFKIDAAEFYTPLREKLNYMFLLLFLLSGTGIVMQRLQLVPLVARLVSAEERNELAIKGLNVGLWDWNVATGSVYWSPRFFEILGLGHDDFGGNVASAFELMHPEDREATGQSLERHFKEGSSFEILHRYRHKDGHYIWLQASGQAKFDAKGEPFRMVGSVIDVTELKKSQDQRDQLMTKLTESNTELERFAYVASHDMQEPLRMITNFGLLLGKEYKDKLGEEGNEYVKLVTESSVRMQSMVEDLLEYARVGNDSSRFITMSAQDELTHVLENLAGVIKEQAAGISADALPTIKANPVQFMRLLQNLIGNGLKYQAKGVKPVIHVGVKDGGHEWLFSVQDNGIGMEQQYADTVFEPFKRLHTWREYKGTGIGLAICKKIVEGHKGKIWVISAPGQGSTFYFTLPKANIITK